LELESLESLVSAINKSPGLMSCFLGTLAVCSAITKALKSVEVQLGGFSGLMLPVSEDAGLVEAANQVSIRV